MILVPNGIDSIIHILILIAVILLSITYQWTMYMKEKSSIAKEEGQKESEDADEPAAPQESEEDD